MSQRLSDYLTQETTDYLEQLDRLLSGGGQPDVDEILRLARGVRGSAQMGGLEAITRVAERLEEEARSVGAGETTWSGRTHELAVLTVRELLALVPAVSRWGAQEETRVREAITRWDNRSAAETEEVVPISSLFFDDAGPHILSGDSERESDEVVSIETLLLAGEGALREALGLRGEVERLLARGADPELRARLEEIFDLIELGIPGAARPAG